MRLFMSLVWLLYLIWLLPQSVYCFREILLVPEGAVFRLGPWKTEIPWSQLRLQFCRNDGFFGLEWHEPGILLGIPPLRASSWYGIMHFCIYSRPMTRVFLRFKLEAPRTGGPYKESLNGYEVDKHQLIDFLQEHHIPWEK